MPEGQAEAAWAAPNPDERRVVWDASDARCPRGMPPLWPPPTVVPPLVTPPSEARCSAEARSSRAEAESEAVMVARRRRRSGDAERAGDRYESLRCSDAPRKAGSRRVGGTDGGPPSGSSAIVCESLSPKAKPTALAALPLPEPSEVCGRARCGVGAAAAVAQLSPACSVEARSTTAGRPRRCAPAGDACE